MIHKGTVFKGTHKNVNSELIGKDDLKTYNKILIMTNAHLTR